MPDTDGSSTSCNLLEDLIAKAQRAGADAADAVLIDGASLSHARRLGKIEKLERSESAAISACACFIGKRQAIVSSNDRAPASWTSWSSAPSRWRGPCRRTPIAASPSPTRSPRDWPELDLDDPVEPARRDPDRARAAPPRRPRARSTGVTNSEGADAGWGRSRVALVASNGFAGAYAGSGHGVSVSVLAGDGTGMERDYDFASAVYGSDLDAAPTRSAATPASAR